MKTYLIAAITETGKRFISLSGFITSDLKRAYVYVAMPDAKKCLEYFKQTYPHLPWKIETAKTLSMPTDLVETRR